jgi:hypothetical protein
MTTHEFNNNSDQAERQRVERDTYLTRSQADADLTSQGRFKRETATRVTGVPVYPSLPASSPWTKGIDEVVGVEPPLGADDFGGSMAPTATSLSDVQTYDPPKPERSSDDP